MPRLDAAAGAYKRLIVTRPRDAAPSYTDMLHVCFPAHERKRSSVGGKDKRAKNEGCKHAASSEPELKT